MSKHKFIFQKISIKTKLQKKCILCGKPIKGKHPSKIKCDNCRPGVKRSCEICGKDCLGKRCRHCRWKKQ